MQLSAFIYGAYTIYTGKPSWVIHNGGQFELVFEREVGKKLDKLSPPSLFAAPKYGFIRLENANINLMAYQNLAVVELLTEQNRKEISYFKLDVKKVVTWLKLTSEELQYKLSAELTGLDFYPISNNGMESVLVISKDDLSKIQVITEY
jgi:hypothetical protein